MTSFPHSSTLDTHSRVLARSSPSLQQGRSLPGPPAPGLKVLALGRLIIPTPGLFSPSYLFCDPSQSAWGLLEHLQILDQPWRTIRAILVFLSSPLPVPPLDSTRLRPLSWALHSGGHSTGCTSSHQTPRFPGRLLLNVCSLSWNFSSCLAM